MTETEAKQAEERLYKKASAAVFTELRNHVNERFTLDDMCRWLNLSNTDKVKRDKVNQVLHYEVRQEHLEQSLNSRPAIYRYVDKTITYLKWVDSKGAKNLPLKWPTGRDATKFGFDGHIDIPEKGLIVLAGVTNTGKSIFCRNFLWMNMDSYKCIYFTSETSGDDFATYASHMTWQDPFGNDGKPKFDLVWRDKDYKDVIDPNAINIVDWLNIYDNFYNIGEVLDGMKSVLDTGGLLVTIQKDPTKGLGIGGMWAEHKASLYLIMDYNRLTVEKAKKWHGWNPNKQSWGFDIIDSGSNFNNIRLLKRCGSCWNGKLRNNQPCLICGGSGYVDDDMPNTQGLNHWTSRY